MSKSKKINQEKKDLEYLEFLKKRLNSEHFKENVSKEEYDKTKAKYDKEKLKWRLLKK